MDLFSKLIKINTFSDLEVKNRSYTLPSTTINMTSKKIRCVYPDCNKRAKFGPVRKKIPILCIEHKSKVSSYLVRQLHTKETRSPYIPEKHIENPKWFQKDPTPKEMEKSLQWFSEFFFDIV